MIESTLFKKQTNEINRYFEGGIDGEVLSKLPEFDIHMLYFHFTIIGNVASQCYKEIRSDIAELKEKYHVIDQEHDDYWTLYLFDNDKFIYLEDGGGEISETNLDKDTADLITKDYTSIYTRALDKMDLVCKSLGYYFYWEEFDFFLIGNGIKTNGSAWNNSLDEYFDNLKFFQEKVKDNGE